MSARPTHSVSLPQFTIVDRINCLLFNHHHYLPPTILPLFISTEVMRRPDRVRFEADKLFSLSSFSAYNKHEIYKRYKTLLGNEQQYMGPNEDERRIDRGHLVPVADFISNPLMASTFKMINVIPQFHSINAGNWNRIEEWARHPTNTPAHVCSGTLPLVLQLPSNKALTLNGSEPHVDVYLQDHGKIPVPLWTFKVVRNFRNVRTVFLQYNNIYDHRIPKPLKDVCRPIACPSAIELNNINLFGYTFCCDERLFMEKYAPHLMQHC